MANELQADLATAPEATPAEADPNACPRCQKPLIDPSGLGWCKACGYCRSLEEEQHNQLLRNAPGPSRGAVLAGVAGTVPVWFWVLVVGIASMAGLSLAAGRLLPAGDVLPRAIWTSAQIGLGVLLVLAGQFVALIRIAPEDERLSFKDALVPTRLWSLVAKRLPRLCGCVWVSAWGCALVVFALLFVGGMKHWFTYLPGAKNTPAAKNVRR